jgi:hypothetical protein
MKQLFWSGVSNNARLSAMEDINQIIGRNGFILDFHRFSDLSISLRIEIQACKLYKLLNELKVVLNMGDSEAEKSDSDLDCQVMLSISFAAGSGDLRIEVPAIPG